MTSKVYSIPTNKKIISVVDDEMDISELFRNALCKNMDGVNVVSFNKPISALEHFTDNKNSYALVISDLKMTGLNRLELLNKVKQLNPKARTMLITAYDIANNPAFENYLKQGIIDSFTEKPIKVNRLCQMVRDEIQAYRQVEGI